MFPAAAVVTIDPRGLLHCDLPGNYAQVGSKAATGCSLSARSPVTHEPSFLFLTLFCRPVSIQGLTLHIRWTIKRSKANGNEDLFLSSKKQNTVKQSSE